MSYEPITYCTECHEPFDVYQDERVCDNCLELAEIAEGEAYVRGLRAGAT